MYRKTRYFNSDVHIYELDPKQEKLDAEIGKLWQLEPISKLGTPREGEQIGCKINATFFGGHKQEAIGTYVDEGKYYFEPSPLFPDVIFDKENKLTVTKLNNLDEVAKLQDKVNWIIGGGFTLVLDGKINISYTKEFTPILNSRHPRTALGQKANENILLCVVDGRNVNSKGVTGQELAQIMLSEGCVTAVNLDGGGSSEMIFDGKIMNKPSDGKERAVGVALISYRKKADKAENEVDEMNNIQLTKNFNLKEFQCKHCGLVKLDSKLLNMLQQLREALGIPITIVSGFRCETHNKAVGGANESYHVQGKACDITLDFSKISPKKVVETAYKIGFRGIGWYVDYAPNFIHVDSRANQMYWIKFVKSAYNYMSYDELIKSIK